MWTIHCNYLNLSIIKTYNYNEKYLLKLLKLLIIPKLWRNLQIKKN